MCGIVGYLGSKSSVSLILESLKHLEYRGYDSAGIAYLNDNILEVYKASGKLLNLEKVLPELSKSKKTSQEKTIGIGHIRWATHGAATDVNAHPHTGTRQEVAIVHNGIIENYYEIRQELSAKGHQFVSETDTESIVQLLEHLAEDEPNFMAVIRKALQKLDGAYALGVISQKTPDHLYAARHQAPLVVGIGEDEAGKPEYIIASDAVAIVKHTNKLIYLKDGEIAKITPEGLSIVNMDGDTIDPVIETISTDPLTIDKKGYKHFMLKEIYEQPDVLRNALTGRLQSIHQPIWLLENQEAFEQCLHKIARVVIIGCGTSFNAGLVGKYFIEDIVQMPVEVESAGEFRYRNPFINENDLVITMSQSGETADTLAALRLAHDKGAKVLTLTNREDSTMAREADFVMPVRAGVEVSVAATKSFTAQVTALYLLGIAMAEKYERQSEAFIETMKSALLKMPTAIESALQLTAPIQQLAKQYGHARDVLFIARGINFPVSMEGALKLKEISYIHAEGYSASELKHGPIAMLDKDIVVISVITEGQTFEKMISNCQEAKAREAQVVVFTNRAIPDALQDTFASIVEIPESPEYFSPLITAIPLQLLAYYIAEFLGKDVDQPRNLAKSVTVE
ncbi:MAG: glutamine--fructose-6-phosphate transaminase (isomerizing) [Cyanobacteria bacterium P01_H01_bin.74]